MAASIIFYSTWEFFFSKALHNKEKGKIHRWGRERKKLSLFAYAVFDFLQNLNENPQIIREFNTFAGLKINVQRGTGHLQQKILFTKFLR